MVLFNCKLKLVEQPGKRKKTKVDFDEQTQIKIFQIRDFLVLSNGCRVKAIDARETLSIKESFGIDKWAKLKDSITQDQLQELWVSSVHNPTFVLLKEDLIEFVF